MLLALMLLLFGGAITCLILGSRWNHRHDLPEWRWRALAAEAPTGSDQRRVMPYVRSGERAPDRETAALTVATARELLRRYENPWQSYGYSLFLAALLLNLIQMVLRDTVHVGVLLLFLPPMVAIAVYLPLRGRRMAPLAGRAIEVNEDLAAEAPGGETP